MKTYTVLNHLCAERRERQLRDLKELFAERDPYDRDAPEQADHQISERHPDAEKDHPDHICQSGDRSAAVSHLFPERPE